MSWNGYASDPTIETHTRKLPRQHWASIYADGSTLDIKSADMYASMQHNIMSLHKPNTISSSRAPKASCFEAEIATRTLTAASRNIADVLVSRCYDLTQVRIRLTGRNAFPLGLFDDAFGRELAQRTRDAGFYGGGWIDACRFLTHVCTRLWVLE